MNSQYKELTDKAFEYQQEGRLNKAEKIYKALLDIEPDDSNILNLMGLLMIAKNDHLSAIDYLTKSFILSKSGAVASNLAKAYYNIEKPDKAVKLYLEALKREESDDIYYSLGLAYKKLNDMNAAIRAYHNALDQNPGNYSACYNLALAYSDIGDIEKAIFYGEKCAILRENDESLFEVMSGFYEQINDFAAAIESLKKAILLNPKNFLYYYNMAVLYTMLDNDNEAISCYLKAMKLNPSQIEIYVNLANLIKERDTNKAIELLLTAYNIDSESELVLLNLAQVYKNVYKYTESINVLNKILTNNPDCDEAYSLLAMNYMDMCQYEKALIYYDSALKLNPEDLDFQHGKAVALKYLGKVDECCRMLENIVFNNDDEDVSLETKVTLGMLYLQNKDFEKGMPLYRLRSEEIQFPNIENTIIWEPGVSIENKTILVYSDCGLGDSIMFSRYLPLLCNKAKQVILQTDKELVSILQESIPMIKVIRKSIPPSVHDMLLHFMDIQLVLGMDFNDIPSSNGYLKANETAVKMFSTLPIFETKKKKVGLFWQGNKKIFKNRSINFDVIKQFTGNKDFTFYSFQKDVKIQETDNFFDLSVHIKDYSDTAALLSNIDVLVTIDSSIAHMAGALGKKTFLLLPQTAEWRWFNDDKSTPWYDSITIFKQKKCSDWKEVLDRVQKAL